MEITFIMKKNLITLLLHRPQQQSGFVILFAMIISTIILILGSGIFSIAYKEALLQSSDTETLHALYAADAGVECALYLDAAIVPAVNTCNAGTNTPVSGATLAPITASAPTLGAPLITDFRLGYSNGTCSHVTVSKTLIPLPTSRVETKIYSQGYNSCDKDIPQNNNPNLVERVLEITY